MEEEGVTPKYSFTWEIKLMFDFNLDLLQWEGERTFHAVNLVTIVRRFVVSSVRSKPWENCHQHTTQNCRSMGKQTILSTHSGEVTLFTMLIPT